MSKRKSKENPDEDNIFSDQEDLSPETSGSENYTMEQKVC